MTTTVSASISALPSDDVLIPLAMQRARALLDASLAETTRAEAASSARMARLLADDSGRDLVLDLTDQVLRIRSPKRAVKRLRELIRAGVPQSLSAFDRFGLRVLGAFAPLTPGLADRAVDWRIDRDTKGVILDAADPTFAHYVQRRTSEGFRLNVNILGEAILGDDEARARLDAVLARMARPDVEYVSVKISALCANLDVLAEEDSRTRIDDTLTEVYRASLNTGTFVNLDMEEFRDLELSVTGFMDALDKPEFMNLHAGIVLQAYIPDSHAALERLCIWANARVLSGGAGIKIRIVKGANLAMESVEAELHDWQAAPYSSKADVDASYKAMVEHALVWGHPDAVRLGIASHNLFEIAWALTVRDALPGELRATERMEIEMLEGMAPPQARAVRDAAGGLLLYSPIVTAEERDASIAYLSRRLDENSAPENFLRALFSITPDSPAWNEQAQRFVDSVHARHTISTASRRHQNRRQPVARRPVDGTFHNDVETDFTSAHNREWIREELASVQVSEPAVIDTIERIDELVRNAIRAQQEWAQTSWALRRTVLAQVAEVMDAQRGLTLATMAKSVGKTLREGDPEVSEAIDFTTYAAHLTQVHEQRERSGLTWTPHSLVVVAGPWNFPYAIPASGLVHAIAAGSAVIMKPAPEARSVAALLVNQLHEAGVPEHLVQLAATPDNHVGQHLITHPQVDMVMLTGSLGTANLFTSWKPDIALNAETSGKNSMVITQAADIDQAIKDLVRSAFGHAGQKCSAASLAIVEAPVYDDPSFARRLADAVRSLRVGDATDPATMMGPLIGPARGPLERALTTLDPGESWLVEPQRLSDTGWTPGVRWDVQPGAWFHLTECFGPVLGIMRARDLDHAIELQNMPIYGLTGGIQSLDPLEIQHWLGRVQVGNAYVNRHITGAIVQRQPFGGWKRSSVGPSAKPGGPDHLSAYGTWTSPLDVAHAERSFHEAWVTYFTKDHDPSGLTCEANILRYHPADYVIARVDSTTSPESEILRAASQLTGVALEFSVVGEESDQALADRLSSIAAKHGDVRLRYLTAADNEVLRAAHGAGICIDSAPVTGDGRTELIHWVREQAVSITHHRYGRLIASPLA